MKKLFNAIRSENLDEVKAIIDKKPELVNCTAKQPPKKDDGQSPLQVALKSGVFDICDFLIDNGTDLNFMEDESSCNDWRTPVVHDAINAAVMCCRRNSYDNNKLTLLSTEEKADRAFSVLKRMLDLGADVNKIDSFGNSAIWRFCLQANQILPTYNYNTHIEENNRLFTPELQFDLSRILKALCDHGADLNYVRPKMEQTVKEHFSGGAMAKLLAMCI